jgi:hypothetical protein
LILHRLNLLGYSLRKGLRSYLENLIHAQALRKQRGTGRPYDIR